jgi:F-type H+-transporting ATPase subunit a
MKHILFLIVLFSFSTVNWTVGAETNNISTSSTKYEEELNVKELILEHLSDSYEWHIFSTKKRDITVHLPVILYSNETGWHFFLSSKLHNIDNNYKGFGIATNGKYKGKIVERVTSGEETRPLDLSITKNAASLLLSSFLLIIIILSVANSIKRDPLKPQKGFAGTMEMFILMINNEVCNDDCQCELNELHVHFNCTHCHKTYCLESVSIPPVQLPEKFLLENINFVMKGLCDKCSES